MKSFSKLLLAATAVFSAGSITSHATNYTGNAATGFGGILGASTLSITDSASTGVLSFSLTTGAALGSGDDVVFYFDSVSGGFSDTSTFSDTGDAGREAASGYDGFNRTLATFTSGEDYAIVVSAGGGANLFQLASGNLTFLSTANSVESGNNFTFNITDAQIGLTKGTGASFTFVAGLLNTTSGNNTASIYRSNETIGTSSATSTTDGNGNPAFTGSLTYSASKTYTIAAVPEPSTLAMMLSSSIFGTFYLLSRKRR